MSQYDKYLYGDASMTTIGVMPSKKSSMAQFTQETELTTNMLENMDEHTMKTLKKKMLRLPVITSSRQSDADSQAVPNLQSVTLVEEIPNSTVTMVEPPKKRKKRIVD